MKIKSARILGVLMSLVLLAGMVIGIPSTASAGTQSWTKVTLPGATNQVVVPVDITSIKVAKDGSIFAVAVAEADEVWSAVSVEGDYRLLKSTDGGKTWKVQGVTPAAGTVIVAVVPSTQSASRVYVALSNGVDVNQVTVSANGGTTFSKTYDVPAAAGNITAMDVAYKGAHIVAVGTDSGTADNVQILDENPAEPVWQALGDEEITGRVLAFAFSPDYSTDGLKMMVGEGDTDIDGDGTSDIALRQQTSAGAWGALTTDGGFAVSGWSLVPTADGGTVVPGAVIGFPDDFDATTNNVTFVGLNQTEIDDDADGVGDADDVYLVVKGAGAPIALGAGAGGVVSLAVSGDADDATIVAGGSSDDAAAGVVRRSADAGETWKGATKAPTAGITGTGSLTFVAFGDTTDTVYAGTSGSQIPTDDGAVVVNDESAFSISGDGGSVFNQISLIDTSIDSVDQLLPAGNTDLFMVTTNVEAYSSLWRAGDATTGGSWTRILVVTDAGASGEPALIVAVPGDYSSTNLLWAAIDDTGEPQILLLKTTTANAGATFTAAKSPLTADAAALDTFSGDATALVARGGNSLLVGDADGNVSRTTNGIQWLGADAVAEDSISSMAVSGANVLVGAADGTAFLSDDSGATFDALDDPGNALPAFVGFDSRFDGSTNSTMYAASGGDIFRWTSATGDVADIGDADAASGLVVLPGPAGQQPTLFVSDETADVSPLRSINPAATAPVFEESGTGGGMPGDDATPAGIVARHMGTAGSQLWVIDTDAPGVLTFTDVMAVVPTQVSPANGSGSASQTSAVVTWEAVPSATANVVVITKPDGSEAGPAIVYGADKKSATITGLIAGETYSWTVQATVPDFSYVSGKWTFTTQLGARPWHPGLNPAMQTSVSPASSSVVDTLTPAFSWNGSSTATGYELKVSKNADMSSPVVDLTGTPTTATAYAIAADKLANGDVVYWQVRAQTASSYSPWSDVYIFTVRLVTTQPPVTIPPQPTPTIILPTPVISTTATITSTVTQAPTTTTYTIPPPASTPTPAWVWAIIAIGGILLIVVIILIARTRKV